MLFRSNNSTNPRLPTLLTGQDYRDIPGFTDGGIGPTYPYGDPSLRVNLRTEDDNDAFSFGDRAIRIAAAGRIGDFDLFGAYAFRERGNYFSGTTAPDYYQQRSEEHTSELQSLMRISSAVFCLKKKIMIRQQNTL